MGYHLNQVKYGNTILNPKVLLDDGHLSSDGGEILWYGEPFFQSGTITGTFCHRDCRRFASAGKFVNSICSACYSIPRIDSFRLKLQRRTDSNVNDSSKTNFTYLLRDQLLFKLREAKEQVECYKSGVFVKQRTCTCETKSPFLTRPNERVCKKRRRMRNCLQHCQSSQGREIERKGWADEHSQHDFEKPVQEEKGQKI